MKKVENLTLSTYITSVFTSLILQGFPLLMEQRDKSPFAKGGFRGNVKV